MEENYIRKWARIVEEQDKGFLDPWDDGYEDGKEMEQPEKQEREHDDSSNDNRNFKPSHHDMGNRAFQNKNEKYGGDDYYPLAYVLKTLENKNMLDDSKREVWLKIDDGNDTMKRLRKICKGVERLSQLMICITEDEFPKFKNIDYKAMDFVRQIRNRATNNWGHIVRNHLIYMNKEDKSVYVCNGMDIEGDKLVLNMEWGDLGRYDPSEIPNLG